MNGAEIETAPLKMAIAVLEDNGSTVLILECGHWSRYLHGPRYKYQWMPGNVDRCKQCIPVPTYNFKQNIPQPTAGRAGTDANAGHDSGGTEREISGGPRLGCLDEEYQALPRPNRTRIPLVEQQRRALLQMGMRAQRLKERHPSSQSMDLELRASWAQMVELNARIELAMRGLLDACRGFLNGLHSFPDSDCACPDCTAARAAIDTAEGLA